jgi:uncharacterized damage-inducible protein DinB
MRPMTQPATATPPLGVDIPSPKQQFAQTFAKEHQTTLKVLRAFPEDQASYKPHDRSKAALDLAWTFVIENALAIASLRGPLDFSAGMPSAPPTFAEVVGAYEAGARELLDTLDQTPDSRMYETVNFFTGPNQMGEFRVIDFLWFIFMDSIHHRGQMSVYLRCAGGKVPSIYGPSADEPWM